MSQSRDPETVLITGASSGIGRALALDYAAAGRRLVLQGRHRARLDGVAADCRAGGADVAVEALDVTDRAAMARWIERADARSPLDLVIANAGVSGKSADDPDPLRTMFRVNVDGVLNTVEPVLPLLERRGRGHIAIMSSLAAFRGMPTAPGYTATKAAVRLYGEGLRGKLMADGVAVSVICPGFVKTPLTDVNEFPMPLLMDPERAARIIRRGLDRRAARIAFPLRLYLLARLVAALPPAWLDPVLQRFQGKE
ncbi:MAG: SDR family NAD(P)-dependent oxidoreductase [Geminicoccaceae bacterium]